MNVFRLKKEEHIPATIALLVFILLNALVIYKYYALFTPDIVGGYWKLFFGHFHVSGFDSLNYITLSKWGDYYSEYRHPLLAVMMYPLYLVNKGLIYVTGLNWSQFVYAVLLIFCAFYSWIFSYRIFRELIHLSRLDTIMLSALLFSFAYIMVAVSVPDHFAISLFLLLLTVYVAGLKMQSGKPMKAWQTALLFVLTSGVTLTNGVKVFIASLYTKGKRFFMPRHIVFAVVIPVAFIISVCLIEYGLPVKSMDKSSYVQTFTDTETSRFSVIVENLFGESIQLHQKHLLEDDKISRPVVVTYDYAYNYIVEILILCLFIAGIWCGRKSKLLWLCLSCFAFDMLLHIGLGFGIDEVYIMGCHWLFVIPISIAYLLRSSYGKYLLGIRTLVMCITAFLWIYNATLFVKYLTV